MKAKILVYALLALIVATVHPAEAQQTKRVPRIGYLTAVSLSDNADRIEAFRQGLRELGYGEGENIIIEYRAAEGKLDRLPALAAELVRLKVDIILSAGPAVTGAAKKATATIPIVMMFDSDPVNNGFIASLAHPGGNITGLSALAPELSGKQLELLREIVPKLSRVAVLGVSTQPGYTQVSKEMELAAGALRVKLQYLDILPSTDIESVFRAVTKRRADAVLVLVSTGTVTHQAEIIHLAAKNRLPAIFSGRESVEAGALMSYGVSLLDLDRRSATYVDKILKGAKPADIPVEQPTKFELVINLKAAKQIGLAIPPNLLARADKVIK
jgi:putative tryptophan/tyrosine transport system substrate-binding protein